MEIQSLLRLDVAPLLSKKTRPRIDLLGNRMGLLTCIKFIPKSASPRGEAGWVCRCDCGAWSFSCTNDLTKGNTRSCGGNECRELNYPKDASRNKHDAAYRKMPKEFAAWTAMRMRCHNPSSPSYRWYGARGISVHPAWRSNFSAFYDHVGAAPSPSHSIDRIDNNRGYEPGNVRWATDEQQASNKRGVTAVVLAGERVSVAQACRKLGVSVYGVRKRIQGGEDPQHVIDAMPQPQDGGRRGE